MQTRPPLQEWSVSARLAPLAGGARATVWRTWGLSPDLVFKSTTRSEESVTWLLPVHDAARAAGFAVPELVPTRSGALIADGWTCETFLKGTPLKPDEMPELKGPLERFHHATRTFDQRPGFLSSQELGPRSSGGDIDFTAMPDSLVTQILTAFAALPETPPCIVHGDITPANTLRLRDGKFALLDWDEARRDLPLFDLKAVRQLSAHESRACLAWEIACCWQCEPDRARRLAERF